MGILLDKNGQTFFSVHNNQITNLETVSIKLQSLFLLFLFIVSVSLLRDN